MSTPQVVDDAFLESLDRQHSAQEMKVGTAESRLLGARINAEHERDRLAQLDAVRKYLAARMGQPVADVLAEVETELREAEEEAGAARDKAVRLQEWHRDLLGHQRVLERRAEEMRATETGEDTPEGKR